MASSRSSYLRFQKPWAYNPQYSRTDIRNPNKGPKFLNQVPTLEFRVWFLGLGAGVQGSGGWRRIN